MGEIEQVALADVTANAPRKKTLTVTLMTSLTSGMSSPRAATSVATNTVVVPA